jgi:hypothetical protein
MDWETCGIPADCLMVSGKPANYLPTALATTGSGSPGGEALILARRAEAEWRLADSCPKSASKSDI